MAEVYFAVTGPLHWVKQFENHMEAQMFHMPATGPQGQPMSTAMGGLMEPVYLYRFISPKAAMPLVLRTLQRGKTDPKGLMRLPIYALRKALGLRGIDDIGDKNAGPVLPVNTEHLQIVLIGQKDDDEGIIPSTGVYQEKV